MKNYKKLLCFILLSFSLLSFAQEEELLPDIDLDTVEMDEIDQLDSKPTTSTESSTSGEVSLDELDKDLEEPSTVEEKKSAQSDLDLNDDKPKTSAQDNSNKSDDLSDLKDDIDSTELPIGQDETPIEFAAEDKIKPRLKSPPVEVSNKTEVVNQPTSVIMKDIFEVGKEEKELLQQAANFQGQVSSTEWNELATTAKTSSYTVVVDDWLFKISKKLFGSGFYYAKIWALNPYITNPHLIEPGMILSFSTGSSMIAPEIKMGEFTEKELISEPGETDSRTEFDLALWGEGAKPDWLDEKQKLIEQSVYVQYATGDTMEDLEKAAAVSQIKEYENYEPPAGRFDGGMTPENYDRDGFDRSSRISFKYKEGFYLNTFVSNNIVQDFGKLENGPDENQFFVNGDTAYVTFDDSMNVVPGDMFSIYSAQGKVKHKNSDRTGYKFTIIGQLKVKGKIEDKWEVEISGTTGLIQRGDRITIYTPKIERILTTFSERIIEAAIMGSYVHNKTILGYGDVVYLDRGRADGVEMGNVFEVYGFKDKSTKKNITNQPTYKNGELTVITLTDNFATALVTQTVRDFYAGDIAITKTKAAALKAQMNKRNQKNKNGKNVEGKELEELDVDLNLDNLGDKLLDQADKIKLTDDELAELERQEREKSILKDSEKDLKALERLEKEIENAEKLLNEAKMDEDKLLEGESLDKIEKSKGLEQEDSLDEIEENMGKRYMDEDLNKKDNPYGLSEFDVEEVDELLNVEKDEKPRKPVKPVQATIPELKKEESFEVEEKAQIEEQLDEPKPEAEETSMNQTPSEPETTEKEEEDEDIMAPKEEQRTTEETLPDL